MAKRHENEWTIRRAREVWSYDPETGAFLRKEKQRGGSRPGKSGRPGGITLNGYRLISIESCHYLAHRLAWALVNNEWPSRAVEHVNGDRLDNRISNLRLKWGDREKGEKSVLSQKRLRELLQYDPETGVFLWKVRTPKGNIGDVAGADTNGYRSISVDGNKFLAHRLAWFYVHGVWPERVVDHINGIRNDNRICNLRDVSVSVNTHNTAKQRSNNTTGFLGVTRKRSMFMARITFRNQIIHIGIYPTLAEARIARLLEEKKRFGEFMSYSAERDAKLPSGDGFVHVELRDGELYVDGKRPWSTPVVEEIAA